MLPCSKAICQGEAPLWLVIASHNHMLDLSWNKMTHRFRPFLPSSTIGFGSEIPQMTSSQLGALGSYVCSLPGPVFSCFLRIEVTESLRSQRITPCCSCPCESIAKTYCTVIRFWVICFLSIFLTTKTITARNAGLLHRYTVCPLLVMSIILLTLSLRNADIFYCQCLSLPSPFLNLSFLPFFLSSSLPSVS